MPRKPSDLTRQSLPFAYMAVAFDTLNDQQHAVQLYSDISGGESADHLYITCEMMLGT